MKTTRKFLVLAPFWKNPSHVGVYRVDRFVRWLSSKNIPVVLVYAGRNDSVNDVPWGVEVSIKDPLNLFGAEDESGTFTTAQRRPNALRRWAAEWLLNPDPAIVWSKRAAAHPLVYKYAREATDILASSPPEAPHVGALRLAQKIGKPLIVDMRDGWLDEPLKPLLQRSKIRQMMENRLESKVLKQASQIFVTSAVWKELLENRLSFTRGKITVLTNAYPALANFEKDSPVQANGSIRLMHAGRFTGSSNRRKPKHLLRPLFDAVQRLDESGSALFLGNLENQDVEDIESYRDPMENNQWTLEMAGRVSRERMLSIMSEMNGLLLLSTSHAAIPSKLFEYLITGKPILASTTRDSAVWRLGEKIPQVYLVDYTENSSPTSSIEFLKACRCNNGSADIPTDFTESELSQIFFSALHL